MPPGRKTLQWNVRLIRDPRSASRWRCRSVFKNYDALVWYSSSLESRWMEPTTVTFYCCNICRRTYVTSPANSSYFSRTVLRRSGVVRRSWTRDSGFHLAGFMTAEQPRPQSNRLQNLGPDAQNDSTRRKCRTWPIWGSFWLTCGTEQNTALLVTPLTSGADVSVYVFRPKEDTNEYSLWLVNLFNVFCEKLLMTLIVNQHSLGLTS